MGVIYVIACSLILSFGAAVGINIQKMSMNKEEQRRDESLRRPPIQQPLWCLGMAIIILDACGDFVFIGMAPQSLLAPLGSLGLGWNIILAPLFHPNEKVTRSIVLATVVIYIGTITTVIYATDSTPTYDLEKIIQFASNLHFIEYFICCTVFQCCAFLHGNLRGYGIVHYCSIAGCFGGLCIILAKSCSELAKNAIISKSTQDWTTSIIPSVLVFAMIATVLIQMSFLNTGLAKFDALVVVPVYQSFWNAFSITGGLIFFQEYQYMKKVEGVMYSIGIFITLIGVMLLVRQRKRVVLPTHID